LRINLVLRVEKSAALGAALRLKGLDLFLAGEFVFKRESRSCGSARILDLPVRWCGDVTPNAPERVQ